MITVIDYGAGNVGSVMRALQSLGCQAVLIDDPNTCANASAIILPGVGNGAFMMERLESLGFSDMIRAWAMDDKPLLGICVGAQVMLSYTTEGDSPCLDIIAGTCRQFNEDHMFDSDLKIPHMGWNEVVPVDVTHPLFIDIPTGSSFYFVHSYYLHVIHQKHIIARTDYGGAFASVIGIGNVYGTQFHPEKSGMYGLRLLYNFLHTVTRVL